MREYLGRYYSLNTYKSITYLFMRRQVKNYIFREITLIYNLMAPTTGVNINIE
jgi:hypothetical protein